MACCTWMAVCLICTKMGAIWMCTSYSYKLPRKAGNPAQMLSSKCACAWQFMVGAPKVFPWSLQGGECSAGRWLDFHSCTSKGPSQSQGDLAGFWVKIEEDKNVIKYSPQIYRPSIKHCASLSAQKLSLLYEDLGEIAQLMTFMRKCGFFSFLSPMEPKLGTDSVLPLFPKLSSPS